MNHLEIVKALLKHNADHGIPFRGDYMPLYHAAALGHSDIIKCLLEHHADIEAKASDGTTACYVATQDGRLNAVRTLIANGANFTEPSYKLCTPIYVASAKGYLDIVEMLSGCGADVNSRNHFAQVTPLYISAFNGRSDVVVKLLELKADPNIYYDGVTCPLVPASGNGYFQIVQNLVLNNADLNPRACHAAVEGGHLDIVKFLVEQKALLETRFTSGFTLLHQAVFQKRKDIVRYLCTAGANKDALTDIGKTPLDIAQESDLDDIAEIIQNTPPK